MRPLKCAYLSIPALYCSYLILKTSLVTQDWCHVSLKDRKHIFSNTFCLLSSMPRSSHSCNDSRCSYFTKKNHSHTSCEYSETIFLCYHHYSEYSLPGSKFSTNLLFAASKCHVTIQRQWQFKMFKMAEIGWCSLLAPCTRKKRLQER